MDASIRNRNAFPQKQPRGAQIAYGDKPGMILRQYYAGLAMQGILAADTTNEWTVQDVATNAVAAADALCEELAKIS